MAAQVQRKLVEAAIELLIRATDIADGDPDIEADDVAEDCDPAEDDDPDFEHDGLEPDDGY